MINPGRHCDEGHQVSADITVSRAQASFNLQDLNVIEKFNLLTSWHSSTTWDGSGTDNSCQHEMAILISGYRLPAINMGEVEGLFMALQSKKRPTSRPAHYVHVQVIRHSMFR